MRQRLKNGWTSQQDAAFKIVVSFAHHRHDRGSAWLMQVCLFAKETTGFCTDLRRFLHLTSGSLFDGFCEILLDLRLSIWGIDWSQIFGPGGRKAQGCLYVWLSGTSEHTMLLSPRCQRRATERQHQGDNREHLSGQQHSAHTTVSICRRLRGEICNTCMAVQKGDAII